MAASRLGAGAAEDLVVAAHEAVANGVEHGTGSHVRVEAREDHGALVVEITTTGSWAVQREMDGGGALAERGRGLAMMRQLADEVELLLDDGCVVTRLRSWMS